MPGRKTDVRDAEWIADLLRHGLLRASFVPARADRELRELVRYRARLIGERASEINRIAKVLEGANIKLGSVSTNLGVASGRAIVGALSTGVDDAEALADLARGRLRAKRDALVEGLAGSVGAHQQFLLGTQLRHLADLDALVDSLDAEIAARLATADDMIARLSTIPGVGRRTAEVILAEIGRDMVRFGSARRLASWAGICPGNYESAGTSHGGRTRRGSPWLRSTLVSCARSASRTRTLPRRPIQAARREAWGAARLRRRWPHHPRDCLLRHRERPTLRGPRADLLRPPRRRGRDQAPHPTPRGSRVCRGPTPGHRLSREGGLSRQALSRPLADRLRSATIRVGVPAR